MLLLFSKSGDGVEFEKLTSWLWYSDNAWDWVLFPTGPICHFLSFGIFFQTIGCAHGWVHSPLISATYVLLENFILKHFLAFSNYWLCIYLAHRWAHSIPCLIPNWSDLPSSSTLTISRSLPHWASEPGILQMKYILGFNFFKCISTSCRWW